MRILHEFKEFAVKGNAVDMMVGLVVGAGFTNVVNSFVKDVLMPPLLMLSGDSSLADRFIVLSEGSYASLEEAQTAGANVWAYGRFINTIIDFIIVAFAVFLVVKTLNRLRSMRTKKSA